MSSVGKDLATIRKHLNYSVEDVHDITKIPLDTIQAIESGDIFKQSVEIKTYVRSFVRTYARALKIKDEIIIKALNQQEAGNYNSLLIQEYPGLSDAGDKPVLPKAPSVKSKKEPEKVPPEETTEPDSDEEGSTFKPTPLPEVRKINWADLGTKISTVQKPKPIWLIGIGIIAIIAVVIAFLIFESDIFTGSEQSASDNVQTETQRPDFEPENGPALDFSETPSETQQAETLADTLYLSIYAATGNLDPVRVWSDLKPRIDPYWIDQGVMLRYEFSDSIRVRGRYSQMLMFLNGHLIENFRQEHFNPEENMVELTRSFFMSDPKWANPVPLEIPESIAEPDSVANRPTF
ncbi:MAG TPA: helix-turn-helix transcriptional regulator [Bacteroidales bacterium]|nr:helix-turn-helix transcriptional regulator [Bacteroidales bacterium]